VPYATPLTAAEADDALRRLPEWTRDGEWISRTVELATFRAAIALVHEVADAAEDADHHPDIDIRWRRVTFRLTTHAAKALTARDVDMASRIDELSARALGIESASR
jgi:4a-hydroxytetrahydrobiopterin dehydratase